MTLRFLSILVFLASLGMVSSWAMRSRSDDGMLQKLGRSVAFKQKIQEIQNHKEVHVLLMDDGHDYMNDCMRVQLEVLMGEKDTLPITFYQRGELDPMLQRMVDVLKGYQLRSLKDLPISTEGELEPYLKATGGSGLFVRYWGFGDKRNTFSPWGPHPFKLTPGGVLNFQGSFYQGPVERFLKALPNRN